jgi:hypothetical protein
MDSLHSSAHNIKILLKKIILNKNSLHVKRKFYAIVATIARPEGISTYCVTIARSYCVGAIPASFIDDANVTVVLECLGNVENQDKE